MIRYDTLPLQEFETSAILERIVRAPETYRRLIAVSGNSVLSSVFVQAMDPGATLDIRYWDTTTGSEITEEYNLGNHLQITPAHLGVKGFTNRIIITKVHNKAFVDAVVAGGNVTFGLYATIVSSFASDLDAALKLEGEAIDLIEDHGLPITVFETSTNTWKFLRAINGRLQVDVPSGIQVTQVIPNLRRYGQSVALNPSVITTHVDYTVPVGKQFTWISGRGSASTWCRWIVTVDGSRYSVQRNAFDLPNVDLGIGGPLLLTAGQRILCTVENLNPYSIQANAETWIYGREETV
jgi:hypothetical protein